MAQRLHLSLLLLSQVLLLATMHPDDEDKLLVEVIVDSSPCSVTCGLGVKNETLCAMTNGSAATVKGERDSWKRRSPSRSKLHSDKIEINTIN